MHNRITMETKYTSTLTISIPAYNDAKSLPCICSDYMEIKHEINIPSTLLIINDGSNDNTYEIMQDIISNNKDITYVHYNKNRGFGTTIKEVFMSPTSEWVFFISGDNQFPIKNILVMQKFMDEYDFIIGTRTVRNDSSRRKFQSKIYNYLISIIYGKKISDVNSIVLLKKELLEHVKLKSKSAFIHAELFLEVSKYTNKIIEVPIIHNYRKHGEGSGGKLNIIIPTIFELFKYKFLR